MIKYNILKIYKLNYLLHAERKVSLGHTDLFNRQSYLYLEETKS